MTNLTDKRRGGFYWIKNKPYVSVPNVLKVIDKPALRYWFGKQVYLAMVVDPTLSEKEALSSPYKTSKKAMSRGTTVHSIVEAYKHSKKHIDDKVTDEWKGYARAFYRWIEEMGAEVLENERTVVNEKYKYAGTLDLLVKIGGKKLVVDVKTGKDIYPEAFMQVAAYKEALEGVDDAAVLLLKEDGTYKYEIGNGSFTVFRACLHIWKELNKKVCEKVGYL